MEFTPGLAGGHLRTRAAGSPGRRLLRPPQAAAVARPETVTQTVISSTSNPVRLC